MRKVIVQHRRTGTYTKCDSFCNFRRYTGSDCSSGSHEYVYVRCQFRKQQIQSLQSCSRSHEISMVKSEHYRISALGIENIGKVFFHTPIQAVSTFYIKSFLICKRNSYMVVFCYFESVFICHFCCPLFLLIIRHLPAGGRPASHQRKAE